MIQFRDHEVFMLLKACKTYQEKTGSEYMWDQYETLIDKLKSYEREVSIDPK